MELAHKRILVTGGAGAVGNNLVKRLLEKNPASIVVLDDLSSGVAEVLPEDSRIRFIEGSVRDEEVLDKIFAGEEPQVVFHLAAHFANQNSVDHPIADLETNAAGTVALLTRCVKNSVERFIYTSSSCVYPHSEQPFDDDWAPSAYDTPYTVSKGVAELYAKFYHEHDKLPVVILRLFNSFGPGEFPGKYRNVIPNFLRLALQGKALPITGTGQERRTFTYVMDTVDMMIGLAQKDEAVGGTFNLASTNDISIQELADTINKLTGNTAGVEYLPPRSWDKVKVRRAKLDRVKSVLGGLPNTPLEVGLKETIAWAKQYPQKFTV
jgi:nucleoside-diphosphate-sugar epimerase